MEYSFEATYYRTALLLGLVRGEIVHRWADQAIEHEPEPPSSMFDIVSVPHTDLSELRHALFPMVVEPEPVVVLHAIFGLLHHDLAAGRRGLADTLTIVRQMRSMLRLPPAVYAELNAALVAHADRATPEGIPEWLGQYADSPRPQQQPR